MLYLSRLPKRLALARASMLFGALLIVGCTEDAGPTAASMSSGEGASASSSSAGSIVVTPTTVLLTAGDSIRISVTVSDRRGRIVQSPRVTWTSSTPSIASVSSTGLIVGISPGSATITASSGREIASVAATVLAPAVPGTVTDLAVSDRSTSSLTLSFTAVGDGEGGGAKYAMRVATPTLTWSSVANVTSGSCALPIVTVALGSVQSCTLTGLVAGTSYQIQLVAFRGTWDASPVLGALSNIASGTTLSTVDLSVVKTVARDSVRTGDTIRFTVVVRNRGPFAATEIVGGDTLPAGLTYASHTVTQGVYSPTTGVWTVGNLGINAEATLSLLATAQASAAGSTLLNRAHVASTASNDSVTGNNEASASVRVVAVSPPAGLLFSTVWANSLGTSDAALTDGGRWNTVGNCGRSGDARVIEIVPGAGLGWLTNVFRVTLKGTDGSGCGQVELRNAVPVSTTHWGRMYYRNDEVAMQSQHNFSYNFLSPIQFIFFNRGGRASGFAIDVRLPASFPYNIWQIQQGLGNDALNPPVIVFPHNTWFRYEWMVEYVTPSTFRFWPRLYNLAGQLVADASNFYQMSTPTQGTFTLASYYAAGNSFPVADVQLARNIGIGNEGRVPGSETGRWYVANFGISTTGWIGQ